MTIADYSHAEGNSGQTGFPFAVTLSNPSYLPITVQWYTSNSTAVAPGDYTTVALTPLTFNPGETSKNVTVMVNGDTSRESNEMFKVTLANPTNATLAAKFAGWGTITNDD